jgi:hypothetical protein
VILILFFAAGSDYNGTVAPQVFIFSSHVRIITFQLPLINDSIYEISESLAASLSFPGPMPPRASIGPDTANITIVDEDCKYIFHFCTEFMLLLLVLVGSLSLLLNNSSPQGDRDLLSSVAMSSLETSRSILKSLISSEKCTSSSAMKSHCEVISVACYAHAHLNILLWSC